jgi:hypothetical protein
LNKLGLTISALFLLHAAFVSYRSIRFRSTASALRGGLGSEIERKMARIRAMSDSLPRLTEFTSKTIYVAAILISMAWILSRPVWLLGPALWLWSCAICYPSLHLTPPSVLLLSNSGPAQVALHVRMKIALSWHRVVSLLDMKQGGISNWDLNAIYADVYRTDQFPVGLRTVSWKTKEDGDQDVWRDVMHRLGEICLLIVMDARSVTPLVIEEARWCLMDERRSKVIFVCDEDKRVPVLEALAEEDREELDIVPESELITRLRGVLRSRMDYLRFLE